MLYPLPMFCCGCSIPVGVYVILMCHLVVSLLYVVSVSSNVIFHVPLLMSAWSVQSQLVYAGFCLLGIPLIVSALFGVWYRIEVTVRLYLYYFMACFLVNSSGLVYICLIQDACASIGSFVTLMSANFGEAFLCGAFRIISYFAAAGGIATQVYCLWIIWSMCQDMRAGQNFPELQSLLPHKESIVMRAKHIQKQAQADFIGFKHSDTPGPYPCAYGAISTENYESSLFGSVNTEMEPNRP